MPNILPPLDERLAYVYCKQCELNGNAKVMMKRTTDRRADETTGMECPLGHRASTPHNAAELEQYSAMQPTMMKMDQLMVEQPSNQAVKWPIWVHPKTKERLEQKFPNNLHTTLGTLMDALSDGSLVFITGPEALILRSHGITNGATAIALVESMKENEKQYQEAVRRLDELQAVLKAAGVV